MKINIKECEPKKDIKGQYLAMELNIDNINFKEEILYSDRKYKNNHYYMRHMDIKLKRKIMKRLRTKVNRLVSSYLRDNPALCIYCNVGKVYHDSAKYKGVCGKKDCISIAKERYENRKSRQNIPEPVKSKYYMTSFGKEFLKRSGVTDFSDFELLSDEDYFKNGQKPKGQASLPS